MSPVLIKGKTDLKFEVFKNNVLVKSFVLEGYTDFDEDYEPVFLSHVLDDDEIIRLLKGFRYRARIFFEKVDGSKLLDLAKIVTVADYDKILFYPNSIDKPLYKIDVSIDDDTIKLSTFYLLAQKEFELKLLGRILVDWVPLTIADFTHWGNISLTFEYLRESFDYYDPPNP